MVDFESRSLLLNAYLEGVESQKEKLLEKDAYDKYCYMVSPEIEKGFREYVRNQNIFSKISPFTEYDLDTMPLRYKGFLIIVDNSLKDKQIKFPIMSETHTTIPIKYTGPTYKTLLDFHNELETSRASIFYMLCFSKIQAFYKKHNPRLRSIDEKFKELSREFFEYEMFEGNERVKMEQAIDESKPKLENGEPFKKWQEVLLPGKTAAGYQQALNTYLSQPVDINF